MENWVHRAERANQARLLIASESTGREGTWTFGYANSVKELGIQRRSFLFLPKRGAQDETEAPVHVEIRHCLNKTLASHYDPSGSVDDVAPVMGCHQ